MPQRTYLDDLVTDPRADSPLWQRGLLLLGAVLVLLGALFIFTQADDETVDPSPSTVAP